MAHRPPQCRGRAINIGELLVVAETLTDARRMDLLARGCTVVTAHIEAFEFPGGDIEAAHLLLSEAVDKPTLPTGLGQSVKLSIESRAAMNSDDTSAVRSSPVSWSANDVRTARKSPFCKSRVMSLICQ